MHVPGKTSVIAAVAETRAHRSKDEVGQNPINKISFENPAEKQQEQRHQKR